MSGKFSQPRPHRDEERQIEETFRQVTEQESGRLFRSEGKVEYTPGPKPAEAPQEDFPFPEVAAAAEESVTPPLPEAAGETPQPVRSPRLSQRMSAFLSEEPEFDEEPEEEPQEPDRVDRLMDRWNQFIELAGKNRRVVLITLCALALVMICGFMGILVGSMSDPYDRKILDNVTILDVQVGGMTKSEAVSAVKSVAANLYAQPMVVDLSGNQITLNPKVTFNAKAAVEAAYDYGRSGTNAENEQAYLLSKTQTYAVPITSAMLEVDDKAIRNALSAYAQEAGATLTQTQYGLEGTQPQLSADKFNEAVPPQTLVITMGVPGVGFDVSDVTDQVVRSYYQRIFLVTVENVEVTKDPDPIDLRAIWEEYHIDPVEAAIDPKTGATTPGAYGYTFDLENAQKLLSEAQFGQVIRIPMEYVEPELLDASAFFRDVLGEYQTRQTSHNARNTNLQLACQAIDGTVVEPGAVFSFNTATGQRTSARGYKTAPGDSTAYTTEYMAGGVSQVSSTLYYAALTADMDITSRSSGTYAPGYIEFGMDADVGSSTDFGFRNTHSYPVRIQAQLSGGYVKIQILGTETREHYVLLEQTVTQTIQPGTTYEDYTEVNPDGYLDGDVVKEGITGYSVKTYKVRYDRRTNAALTRDFIATTNYRSEDRVLAKIEVPETTVPPTTVPPATVPPTTIPPTTVPPTTTPPTTQATTEATTEATTQPTTASETSASEHSDATQSSDEAAA